LKEKNTKEESKRGEAIKGSLKGRSPFKNNPSPSLVREGDKGGRLPTNI